MITSLGQGESNISHRTVPADHDDSRQSGLSGFTSEVLGCGSPTQV
jgi:hypothetical protein